MRKFLLLLIASLATLTMNAGEVTEQQALQKAQQFMKGKKFKQTNLRRAASTASNAYYVFNAENNSGFVVVAGEDRMPDILMFSENGTYIEEEIPSNMKAWLESYAKQVNYLRTHPEAQSAKRNGATKANISNLLDCWYDQRAPYNNKCPVIDSEDVPTGCVATAMAQIMYYYQWPKQTSAPIPEYTTWTSKIYVASIPVTAIDWNNILPRYNNGDTYNSEQADAISTLMQLCGSAVEMDYKPKGSGASNNGAKFALKKYFGYSDIAEEVYRDYCNADDWEQLIYDELNAKRPILYGGLSTDFIGHSFVLDGYKDGMFHVNWGWGGMDSYVSMASGDNWHGFTMEHSAVINIQPDNGENTSRYAIIDGTKMTLYYDKKKSQRSGALVTHQADWQNYKEEITEFVFDASYANLKLRNLYSFFTGLEKLQTISGIENLNTENVIHMGSMFKGCTNLKSLDVSKFKTSKVADMSQMFSDCKNLTTLDVSGFNTANVLFMELMFYNCQNLTTLDVSKFETSKVTNMANMFDGCTSLTSLDVSGFNTANVTDMGYMFLNCQNLTTLDVSKFSTNNVTDMSAMFYLCKNLTTLDVSKFNTANVTDMRYMFCYCQNLTTLDVSKFNTANVTDMQYMFSDCKNLTTLDVSGFNTANVTDMGSMFLNCQDLTTLDVSKFETGKVTDMLWMFGECTNLTSLDVSGFNTANVNDMRSMFYNCKNLTTLDVSKFETSKVTNMANMFDGCTSLTSLDVSGFNTANVTDMGYMFLNCQNLTTLDVSKFSTNNVTNMSEMFRECTNLTNLDVSSFSTKNVTDMMYMFGLCSNLKTIYSSERWDMTNVEKSLFMFYKCEKLVGGSGTTFDSSKIHDEYARIDEGSTNPGYFTYKATLYTITYMVDGEVYKTDYFEVGATITPETAPVKEGYTFSGWSNIPATMPAEDIVITGSFTINSYSITYIIDDAVYQTETMNYGATITPPTAPQRDGYIFEWIDVPATMPAKDIIIIGSYTLDIDIKHADKQDFQWFTLEGKPIDSPRKGINIIRKPNGSSKKVIIK